MDKRMCGVLFHITSLGEGTLSKDAFDFACKLHKARQSVWQVLPMGPVLEGSSPYFSDSVFAGGEHFIDKKTVHNDDKAFAEFKEQEAYWLNDYALFKAIKKRKSLMKFKWNRVLKVGLPWWLRR